MTEPFPHLRLNQGDASEARIYYAAHLVAARLGLFEDEKVSVAFTRTESGGHSIRGGQVPALLDGSADLAIGGPMVAMRMQEDGEARVVSFGAAAGANPWVLIGRLPEPRFTFPNLAGCRILDMAGIGTATFAFRRVLAEAGLRDDGYTLLETSGSLDGDLARLERRDCDYAFHSLHALCEAIAVARVAMVADLAPATRPVPWSAYMARPEAISADRGAFAAFTRAIARAQAWIVTQEAATVADLIRPDFPDITVHALATAIGLYQRNGVFAPAPFIARADYERFGALLVDAGWLSRPPSYAALVDTDLAQAALERLP